MGKYDGPAFLKKINTKPDHAPAKPVSDQTNQMYKQSENIEPKQTDNSFSVPKQAKRKAAEQSDPAIYEAKTVSLKDDTSYRPSFRVTEVPSPMFGYTNQKRQQLRKKQCKEQSNQQWDYTYLKKYMRQKLTNKEFIITEECVTPRVISRWQQSHSPSIQKNTSTSTTASRKKERTVHSSKQTKHNKKRN